MPPTAKTRLMQMKHARLHAGHPNESNHASIAFGQTSGKVVGVVSLWFICHAPARATSASAQGPVKIVGERDTRRATNDAHKKNSGLATGMWRASMLRRDPVAHICLGLFGMHEVGFLQNATKYALGKERNTRISRTPHDSERREKWHKQQVARMLVSYSQNLDWSPDSNHCVVAGQAIALLLTFSINHLRPFASTGRRAIAAKTHFFTKLACGGPAAWEPGPTGCEIGKPARGCLACGPRELGRKHLPGARVGKFQVRRAPRRRAGRARRIGRMHTTRCAGTLRCGTTSGTPPRRSGMCRCPWAFGTQQSSRPTDLRRPQGDSGLAQRRGGQPAPDACAVTLPAILQVLAPIPCCFEIFRVLGREMREYFSVRCIVSRRSAAAKHHVFPVLVRV